MSSLLKLFFTIVVSMNILPYFLIDNMMYHRSSAYCSSLQFYFQIQTLQLYSRYYYKVGQKLLQSGAALIITKRGKIYYKVGQLFYYKVGQDLLQSGAGITKWGNVITKRGRYYKVGQLLQSGA